MRRGCVVLIGLWIISLVIAGCAGPSRLEMDYGTSFKLSKFNQILDPDAQNNLEPVTGFDSKAAEATIERYEKSFEQKSQPPVYTINIGGGSGGITR